jgi:Mn2+/Fe2+ NRAMP family transporter
LITGLTLVLEVFVSYRVYARYLKFLALSLFAYIAVVFVVKQDWASILVSTVLPSITYSKEYLMVIVAIFGTTISPYLFFWQADEEVEEEVAAHKLRTMGKGVPRITRGDIRKMRLDTLIGMVFSCIVMFFIIATTASTLHVHGITSIETANQAAEALKPFAGEFTHLLFAAGIIGTGLLAVPILAGSASYALSETFGWKEGLYRRFTQAHGFYGVITIATIVGLIINFTPIPPFKMLFYTAILNGVCAPPLLVLIMLISNNRKIMGENVNKTASNIFGWAIAGVMSLTALALAISLF